MQILGYFLARFSEPSSYAGLGAVFALLGWHLSESMSGQLIQLAAGACGVFALALRERGLLKAIVLVVAMSPALSACGGLVAAGSVVGASGGALAIASQVSGAVDTVITTACKEYAAGTAAANAIVASGMMSERVVAKIASIENFGDAACASPPPGDPLSTAIWLGHLAGQVTTLTSSAEPGA